MDAKNMLSFLKAPAPTDMRQVVCILETGIHNITNHGQGCCVYGYGWERDAIVVALANYLKRLDGEKIPTELLERFHVVVRRAAWHLMWWLNSRSGASIQVRQFQALAYLWPHKGSAAFLEDRFVVEHESLFPLIYYGIQLGNDGQKTLLEFRQKLLAAQSSYAVGTVFETGRQYEGSYKVEKEFAVNYGGHTYLGRRTSDGFETANDVFTRYEPVAGQEVLFMPYGEFDPKFPWRLFQVCPPKQDMASLLKT